ncbi:hypothetical protein IEQ34_009809 [Dendrobium chrysotoxum]|uniref:Uncharacterized protein n=1 Tax=Dendrobium chrysotoxum TaxID=161865 RepID=A0AAV7H2G2_DENCH|nr:hypothetical protein IEQ34_009809 [Dendrobium chrysotoxum]
MEQNSGDRSRKSPVRPNRVSQSQTRHSGHWFTGRVFCIPALSGHGASTGGTMQLYWRQREVVIGISAAGDICIPLRKLCCK